MAFQSPTRSPGRHPESLRALAHPLRLEILEQLASSGPMTASGLGARLHQSAANCSWHLRKPAEHGFVTEAGGGGGRARPWQVVPATLAEGGAPPREPSDTRARELLAQVLVDREVALFGANRARDGDPPWDDLQRATQAVVWLTLTEAQGLAADLTDLIVRYGVRGEGAARSTGSRAVRLLTLTSVDAASER